LRANSKRKKRNIKATHFLQGLTQPDSEDLSIYHVVKKPRKIKNFNVRQGTKRRRSEAIWATSRYLKFLQDKECKAGNKDLKKTRESRFFCDE
jgi:hypothetical protein